MVKEYPIQSNPIIKSNHPIQSNHPIISIQSNHINQNNQIAKRKYLFETEYLGLLLLPAPIWSVDGRLPVHLNEQFLWWYRKLSSRSYDELQVLQVQVLLCWFFTCLVRLRFSVKPLLQIGQLYVAILPIVFNSWCTSARLNEEWRSDIFRSNIFPLSIGWSLKRDEQINKQYGMLTQAWQIVNKQNEQTIQNVSKQIKQ